MKRGVRKPRLDYPGPKRKKLQKPEQDFPSRWDPTSSASMSQNTSPSCQLATYYFKKFDPQDPLLLDTPPGEQSQFHFQFLKLSKCVRSEVTVQA